MVRETPELVRNWPEQPQLVWLSVRLSCRGTSAFFGPRPAAIGLGVGQSDLIGSRTSGGLGKRLGGVPQARQPPGRCSRKVPGTCQQKFSGLGFLFLGRHGGGSRPALPGLHDVLSRSQSSGSFGLRVAVVEPFRGLGFRGLGV